MKQRGFTLIELLAVIVILAIIALIATPMIMDVIDKARKGVVEASTTGYIDAIEKYTVVGMLDQNTSSVSALPAGIYDYDSSLLSKVEVKGEKPTGGWIFIDHSGLVVAASLKFNSYTKYVGYTVQDRAKAILDANITKPIQTESQTMTDFEKTAVDTVHNALNSSV